MIRFLLDYWKEVKDEIERSCSRPKNPCYINPNRECVAMERCEPGRYCLDEDDRLPPEINWGTTAADARRIGQLYEECKPLPMLPQKRRGLLAEVIAERKAKE